MSKHEQPVATMQGFGVRTKSLVSEGPDVIEASPTLLRTPRSRIAMEEIAGKNAAAFKVPKLRSERSVGVCELGMEVLRDHYHLIRRLGRGAYGEVWKARCLRTGLEVAVKTIKTRQQEEELEAELSKRLNHPHIVRVHEILISSNNDYHIVLDLCEGGDLATLVRSSQESARAQHRHPKHPDSREIGVYMKQLLSAVAYLHHHRIAHRDVTPQNCLLTTTRMFSLPPVKLADFGLACKFTPGVKMTECVGTMNCIAPEVLKGPYDERCDVWGVGAVGYFLVTGGYVFKAHHLPGAKRDKKKQELLELQRAIITKEVVYDEAGWASHRGHGLQELVKSLLQKDVSRRPAAHSVLTNDRWLQALDQGPRCCAIC